MKKYYPGKKIGKLTILKSVRIKSYYGFECQCDCGNIITVARSFFSKSEICCDDCRTPKVEDISGQRFGRLTAIRYAGKNKGRQTLWECRCDCGKTVIVHQQNLKSGHTSSYGCYNIDCIIERGQTHGETKTRLYNIWHGMIYRCYYEKHDSYKDYGGKGVTVCDEWKNSFETFRDWAYQNGYSENLTIDRIDNTGNYCPENCRWATDIQQANNTSRNLVFTVDGYTDTLANLCRKYDMRYSVAHGRIRNGWDVEKALKTPAKEKRARR